MSSLFRGHLMCLLLLPLTMLGACSEDNEPAAPATPMRSVAAAGTQDYTWIDLRLSNFPSGSTVSLRTPYYETAELTADPQARVVAQSDNLFRVEFTNLSAGNFVGATARILLSVDSVVDELQGIVVLCDETGPIILAPECAGNCAPLCGLPGHDCDG